MKKLFRYLAIAILLFGVIFATLYFIKTNSKSIVEYDTQNLIVFNCSIINT